MQENENTPEKNRVSYQIKRNTILLVANNILINCITAFILTVSPIIIYDSTKSIALASISTSLILSADMPTNLIAGKLADNIGRKKTLLMGTAISLIGLFLIVTARFIFNIWFFWAGITIFGLSTGFLVLNRAAITDMYPKNEGRSLGYLNAGGFLGSILAPIIVAIITGISTGIAILANVNFYDLIIYLSVPLLFAAGFLLFAMPRDTKDIAKTLKIQEIANQEKNTNDFKIELHHKRNLAFAILASSIAVGAVAIALSLTPTLMHISNAPLWIISFSIALISLGSNGLSILSGMLSDKLGRKNIILIGTLIMGLGLTILPITQSAIIISVSNFLIGFGGGAMAIASTSLICNLVVPDNRGKMLGLNSFVVNIFTLFLPPLAAALFTLYQPFSVSILGLAIAASTSLAILLLLKDLKQ